MRAAVLMMSLLALASCGDRRSFDERYQDTSQELENRAQRLDQNLATAPAQQNDTAPGAPDR